ncbi:MAG: S8 family serine peptidase [Gaiellaceae bacterium]
MTRIGSYLGLALVVAALAAATGHSPAGAEDRTQVVVTLSAPPLARDASGAARVAVEQERFEVALAERVPEADVRWRYRLVANGLSVVLPTERVADLRRLPGVEDVFESTAYVPQLDDTPQRIGATALWGPQLETAGQGMKIGIIDTGVDPEHPFFDPSGFAMPAGFPKGQTRFTTAKVIVARAFPPPGARSQGARLAFDGLQSSHGTHVAGIAAGNARTTAVGGRTVSGVAPRAYLGNYKALVRTDAGLSPNGNSPEIVAAIEAAVRDGMDVLNLSIGEPEIEPSRDIVARALDAAAAAGVVSVVAAGNDFNDVGAGSVSSPGSSARAISVGAVELTSSSARHAEFSSVGPTPVSHRLKPDVLAPGVAIISATPDGGWASFSGTSMASPHVAGAAALLRQRHPGWSVDRVKSALVQTGGLLPDGRGSILGPQFQGGGLVRLDTADVPLVSASTSGISLGLLARGATRRGTILLEDVGGGAGGWEVADVRPSSSTGRANVVLPASVDVPGTLAWEIAAPAGAREGEVSGYVVLRRGADVRRIPFWGRVTAAHLGRHAARPLVRQGTYRATTRGRPAYVTRYRYPEDPRALGVTTVLRGPELVYRVRLQRQAINFGVAVTQRGPGSRVEPRVVQGLDENRLTGYAGLPLHMNPYLEGFRSPVLAAGALSPRAGEYGVVFDSGSRATAGTFTFRLWVDDVTPPTLRFRSRAVRRGQDVVVVATDAGSGVYGPSIRVLVDGRVVRHTLRNGVIRIPTSGLARGRYRLQLRVSDVQETKNTENVRRILPNTRTVTTAITIR